MSLMTGAMTVCILSNAARFSSRVAFRSPSTPRQEDRASLVSLLSSTLMLFPIEFKLHVNGKWAEHPGPRHSVGRGCYSRRKSRESRCFFLVLVLFLLIILVLVLVLRSFFGDFLAAGNGQKSWSLFPGGLAIVDQSAPPNSLCIFIPNAVLRVLGCSESC